jgi:hypothetical protein
MAKTPGNWIEPPPPERAGLGCAAKTIILLLVFALLFVLGVYLFVSHGLVASAPTALPVQELAPEKLQEVQQRIEQFQSAPIVAAPTPQPAAPGAPDVTPTPDAGPTPTGKQLVLSAGEINGLIAANKKARGHAFVSLNGDTALIQVSVPSDKIPGVPRGYLNGTFTITTDGPTPIGALQVEKIRANGYPVPTSILSMSYRGQSLLSYALGAASPYNVSSAEVSNGNVVLH